MRLSVQKSVAVAVTGCLSVAASAVAQESGLEEIIVTAQKREQDLSEVPISIVALNGEQIARSGVTRIEDLYAIAPSVNFSPAQSSAGAGLRVRGVGSAGYSNMEPSVSTLIDGVVSGPGGAALTDLFDVERIEVMRGPQGTLFGKNASAGAVNIVSRAPTDDLSGYSLLRYGDTLEETRFEGAVSGAVTDNLRARLAGYGMKQNEGQVYNPVRETDENKRERWGLRFRTDYTMGDTVFDFTVQYEEQDNACCRTTFYGLQPLAYGPLTRAYLLPRLAANDVTPSPDNRTSIADGPLSEATETLHAVLSISHEFESGHVLRSITGRRDWHELDTIDVDGVDVNIGNEPRQERDLDLLTQEFQFLSPTGQRFEYVLGAYFYDQDSGTSALTAGGAGTILGQSSTLSLTDIKVTNYAVFADGTYDVTPRWQAFAGLRLLHEKMELEQYRTGNYFAFPPPGTFTGATDNEDDDWVGRAGVRFIQSDDVSWYLSASRGYKGSTIEGGNVIFNPATRDKAIIDPETVESYELGVRSSLIDNRLSLNATVFYSNFFDYQASSFDNTINNQILRNAGELNSQGVELDFAAVPWKGMSLSGGVAYVDATFVSYVGAPCTAVQNAQRTCPDLDPGPGVVRGQDLSGEPLHNSPKWQYNVRAQQDFDVSDTMGAYARAEYFWRDEVIYGGDLNPDTTQPSFGLANFRVGMTFDNAKYEVSAFVENAFDESYALRIYDSPGFTGAYSGFYGAARTYGVEMRTKF